MLLAPKAKKATLVRRVTRDLKERTELRERKVLKVRKASKEPEENGDPRGRSEKRANKEYQAFLAIQVPMGRKVRKDSKASPARKASRATEECKDHPEKGGRWGHEVIEGPVADLEKQAPTEKRAASVSPVLQDNLEREANKDPR